MSGRLSTLSVLEESEEVVVLTVDVTCERREERRGENRKWRREVENFQKVGTADLERRFQLEEDRLVDEDLSGFDTETADFLLCDIGLFARLVFFADEELFDDVVDVDVHLFYAFVHRYGSLFVEEDRSLSFNIFNSSLL